MTVNRMYKSYYRAATQHHNTNKPHTIKALFFLLLAYILPLSAIHAQSNSDSVIVQKMREQGVSFTHDNSVTLLTNGQEKFDDLFAHIKEAKKSIHLEYFNFRNDSIAGLLFDLLAQKAAEGVQVRALFDAFGNASNNQPLKKRHLAKLREKGIEIYVFDPLKFPYINHVFSRDHRKIVVIDGKTAYTGGMNVADYYINGTRQVGEWHDMHCRIEGSEVATLQQIFIRIWNKTTHQKLKAEDFIETRNSEEPYDTIAGNSYYDERNSMVGILNREPRKSNKIIRQFYQEAISCARDSVKIINPYMTLNRKLKKTLRKAVERGVKVEIMVSTHSDIPLTPDCVFYNMHRLMKRGVTVWMYERGFHHTKIMMVDGNFCTVGSANLNARSLRWDYEANALIIDKNTTKALDNLFERDKNYSFKLTKESWNKFRTRWKKTVGWFAHLLSPFL